MRKAAAISRCDDRQTDSHGHPIGKPVGDVEEHGVRVDVTEVVGDVRQKVPVDSVFEKSTETVPSLWPGATPVRRRMAAAASRRAETPTSVERDALRGAWPYPLEA